MDIFGFKSAGEPAIAEVTEPVIASTESTTITEPVVTTTEVVEPVVSDQVITTEPATIVAEVKPETVYTDPFAELGNTERSIFDSIKNKDYASLKGILDKMTTNYDTVSDLDIVRQQIKDSKPRWSNEMIDAELTNKYGYGLDDDELSAQDKLKYKRDLLDDADAARVEYKGKQSEIKFPEWTPATQEPIQAKQDEVIQQTPEQIAKFKEYWEGHIENSVKDLTDEVFKIEVGRDGNKEFFDFPVSYTEADKQALKEVVANYDINDDFRSRYVKDDAVDLKKLMSDRFKTDNFDRLLRAAFAQGHSQGKLGQIKGDKNLGTSTTGSTSSTNDTTSVRTNAANFFLNNGRVRK